MGGEERELVGDAFDANYMAPVGPSLNAFERDFCDYVGIEHSLALSSGTAAVHLALLQCGVGPGSFVFGSTLTFVGSVGPAAHLNAELVFIDSDECTWNMDPELLQEEIDACLASGGRPGAVVVTDLYGQCADFDKIRAVCDPHGIVVISDAAEAMGATYKGRHAGKGADIAVYSFNGNKIITTSGGGMLASDDADVVSRARHLATQAREPFVHYEHREVGFNYRMSNVLAAIGRGQLRVLDERVKRRREIEQVYRNELGGLAGISFMPEAQYGRSNRWLTVILIDEIVAGANRESVRLALEAENIESRPVWKPMHLQPAFSGCRVRGGAVAEKLFRQGLCLPSGTAMTANDLERICSAVKKCWLPVAKAVMPELEKGGH